MCRYNPNFFLFLLQNSFKSNPLILHGRNMCYRLRLDWRLHRSMHFENCCFNLSDYQSSRFEAVIKSPSLNRKAAIKTMFSHKFSKWHANCQKATTFCSINSNFWISRDIHFPTSNIAAENICGEINQIKFKIISFSAIILELNEFRICLSQNPMHVRIEMLRYALSTWKNICTVVFLHFLNTPRSSWQPSSVFFLLKAKMQIDEIRSFWDSQINA